MNPDIKFMTVESFPYHFWTDIPCSIYDIYQLKIFDITNPMESKIKKESYFKYKVQLLNEIESLKKIDIHKGDIIFLDIPKICLELAWSRAKMKPIDPRYKWNLVLFVKRLTKNTIKIMPKVEYEYYE